ncbi:hypothetical protein GCM10027062_41130 [Nocardioides hungaricus]
MHDHRRMESQSSRRRLAVVVLVISVVLGSIAIVSGPAAAGTHPKPKPKPKVSAITPARGNISGGTTLSIRGRNLTAVKAVTVGGRRATDVRVISPRKVRAVTPAGFAGPVDVRVVTKRGTSKPSKASRFTYTTPRPIDTSQYEPAADTVLADEVEWVAGGTLGDDGSTAGATDPWLVGLGPAAEVPEVGSGFFLQPGGRVFPSGLAGTVSEVSTQADGGVALTIEPAPLSRVMDSVSINYSGPLEMSEDGAGREPVQRAGLGTLPFPKLGPSAFQCTDQNSRSVSFSGELGLRLENTQTSFFLQTPGIGVEPAVDAWVRADLVLTGKITASSEISCELRPEWQNAQRRVFPIGTTGATISLGPAASFSVSGEGTLQLTQRTRMMVGLSAYNNNPQFLNVRRDLGTTVQGGDLSVVARASAGVSVQIGALDRIGVEITAQLAATAKLSAQSPPPSTCVDLVLSFDLSIGGFLDVWIARWTSSTYDRSFPLASWAKCLGQVGPSAPSTDPAITSLRLPAATNGTNYEARLTTLDNREGRWSISRGTLPTGLELEPGSGQVTGRPMASIRNWFFDVTFTDGDGRSTTETVQLFVNPMTVGSGDIQVTLLWNSPADLDLHVLDPLGEHIYYGEPGPTTSGGFLDNDANAGCSEQLPSPIENVYWPQAAAPSGTYTAYVQVWSDCGATDLSWRLIVRIDGRVVIDRTGQGDSEGYLVTVGQGAAVRVTRGPAPRTGATVAK